MGVVMAQIIDNVDINNVIGSYSKKMNNNVAGFTIFFSDDVIKQNMGVVMVRIIDNVNISNVIGSYSKKMNYNVARSTIFFLR